MHFEQLVRRVRGEFHEMPGLRLTLAQACRLWHVDQPTCEAILKRLVQDGVLYETREGRYTAFPSPRGAGAPVPGVGLNA